MELIYKLIIGAIVAFAMYMLVSRFSTKTPQPTKVVSFQTPPEVPATPARDESEGDGVAGYQGDAPEGAMLGESNAMPTPSCGGAPGMFVSSDLLPKNDQELDSFDEFAPKLDGQNFVDSYKFVQGEQSQSLRNANLQLRSEPPNPQSQVCPWMQSTIYPENRPAMEIGCGQA